MGYNSVADISPYCSCLSNQQHSEKILTFSSSMSSKKPFCLIHPCNRQVDLTDGRADGR